MIFVWVPTLSSRFVGFVSNPCVENIFFSSIIVSKSTCRHCHGLVGQVQGCGVAGGGLLLRLWHGSHFCIISSICLSMLDHQT